MIIIELEGKDYKMPENWNEVNVGLFEEIVKMTSILSEYKSEVQYTIDMFSVLTGAPADALSRMTRKGFEDLSKVSDWVNDEVKPGDKRLWVFDGIEYMPVEKLDSLSMGDSVSLELIIKDSNEATILTNILPILIRKVKKVQKENGKVKKVPGDFDADGYEELKNLFKERLMVTDVINLKSFF
jgi:hypothetical protein